MVMGIFGKICAGLFGGLLFAALGYMALSLPFASTNGGENDMSWLVWVLWVAAIVMTYMANSAGKAWRRLLISCAVFSLLIPISTLIMSTVSASDAAMQAGEHAGAAAAGAMIGGGMVAAFTGFIGFFLAAIFLIIGLLVGRNQPVTA